MNKRRFYSFFANLGKKRIWRNESFKKMKEEKYVGINLTFC